MGRFWHGRNGKTDIFMAWLIQKSPAITFLFFGGAGPAVSTNPILRGRIAGLAIFVNSRRRKTKREMGNGVTARTFRSSAYSQAWKMWVMPSAKAVC